MLQLQAHMPLGLSRMLLRLALLVALIPASAAAQTVDLRPKLVPGQTHRFEMRTSAENAATNPDTPDQTIVERVEQTIGLRLGVRSADDSGSVVDLTVDSLKVVMDSPVQRIEFDSASPASGDATPFAKALRGVIGATLTISIDPAGNIRDVTGLDRLALGGQPGVVARQVAGVNGRGGAASMILSPRRGRGEARVGEAWTNEDHIETPGLGRVTLVLTHRLESADEAHADASFKGGLEASGGEGAFKIVQSDIAGTYRWDRNLGMLQSLSSRQKSTLDSTVPGVHAVVTSTAQTTVTRLGP